MSDTKGFAGMQSLGEIDGRQCFWAAPGQFARPGFYYWDGTRNVRVPLPPPAYSPILEAMAKAAFDAAIARSARQLGMPSVSWQTEPEALREDWRANIIAALLRLKEVWGPRASDPYGDKAQIVVDEVLR